MKMCVCVYVCVNVNVLRSDKILVVVVVVVLMMFDVGLFVCLTFFCYFSHFFYSLHMFDVSILAVL